MFGCILKKYNPTEIKKLPELLSTQWYKKLKKEIFNG